MPLFWFSGSSPKTTDLTAGGGQPKSPSVSISSRHARTSSLSLSASSGQNARLAEVRSKATASYLQNQERSGNHRRTQSGDTSRRSRASLSGHGKRVGGIIAIEDDDDSKHRGRIDQGLIDACNEAKVSQTKASWWTSFSATSITPPSSFLDSTNSIENASKLTPSIDEAALKHKRTVSKTTYRV
jgi:hypothetical protein